MNSISHGITTAAMLAALTAAATVPATAATLPPTAAATKSTAAGTVVSVADRFRSFTGPRTPSSLSALFNAPVSATVTQKPELVLSNGTATLNISVTASAADRVAPNFAVNGGTLISSHLNPGGQWLLTVLPDKGTLNCSLIVLSAAGSTEYPLTVAPPLSPEFDLSPQGFADFLGAQTGSSTPRLDLNADGRRDYQDDYIFTANFLARKMADPHDPGTRNQRARELTPQRLLKPAPATN